MSRPLLEVAAIFRDHGAAWRKANAGHVSLGQMKVMSAIERCRTAALGGMSGAVRTRRALTPSSPTIAALWANLVEVSWRPASAANLAFFKWFGVDQPAFCSPLQRLCAEIGRPEIALRGDTRSSLRVAVDRTRETCDHRNLPAPWIPTKSSKPLRPLGHLLCGNDPLTSGRLIAGPRGGP